MRTAHELIATMGKKKFVEFASAQQKGRRMLEIERRRGLGKGRIFSKYCVHGKQLIRDFEEFETCNKWVEYSGDMKLPDFEPHFNIGLGCYIESKSEMKRVAKQQGMEWIGDDRR